MPREPSRPGRSDADDLDEKCRIVAGLAVAGRLAAGQSHEQIRAEAVKVASAAIGEFAADEFEHERLVSVVQRTVDELLAEGGRSSHGG